MQAAPALPPHQARVSPQPRSQAYIGLGSTPSWSPDLPCTAPPGLQALVLDSCGAARLHSPGLGAALGSALAPAPGAQPGLTGRTAVCFPGCRWLLTQCGGWREPGGTAPPIIALHVPGTPGAGTALASHPHPVQGSATQCSAVPLMARAGILWQCTAGDGAPWWPGLVCPGRCSAAQHSTVRRPWRQGGWLSACCPQVP